MDCIEYITLEKKEYEQLLKERREASMLRRKVSRLEKDLTFHAVTAANLERIRSINDAQKEEYYFYNILLLKNCPGNLFVFDLSLNFVLCSEKGLRITKQTANMELTGTSFKEFFSKLVPEYIVDQLYALCQNALETREETQTRWELPGADQASPIQVIFDISPAIDNDNQCVGIVLVINDVTELTAEREKAIRASNAKSTFLANMSHDIRTPMNAVIGMSELLLFENLTPKQKEYTQDILFSAKALVGLINDILDFSKIEEGKMEIKPIKYNLPQLLANINSMLSHSAKEKGIEYIVNIDKKLPAYLYGDDIRVRQILNNIIGNAIKFTSVGEVRLDVYIDDGFICFDVSDTGAGIRDEDMEKLFTAFTQLNDSRHRNITGSGLGLSITKSLVIMLNGEITVESVYGKGSVFHIKLPMEICDQEGPEKYEADNAFIQAPTADILIVDDNIVNLKVAKNLLMLWGIKADTSDSGMDAFQKIKEKRYDIVFMDHMMPEMDGIETAAMLRENGFGKDKLIIIALSANAIEGAKQLFLDAGMQDFLSKPIEKTALNNMLKKWLPESKILFKQQAGENPVAQIDRYRHVKALEINLALKRADGDNAQYWKYLNTLIRNLPYMEAALNSCAGNAAKLAAWIHKLGIMLEKAGVYELYRDAVELEQYAVANNLLKCEELISVFIEKLHGLMAEIHVQSNEDRSNG